MSVKVNASEGTVSGDLTFCLPLHMNFGKLFLERILKYGNKVAMIDAVTEEQITFSEIAQQIVTVAYSLVKLGVKQGDVIAICSENKIEVIVTSIAVLYSGAILTFFNCSYSRDEINHIADISKPKYVFMSPTAYDGHYNTLKGRNTIKQFFIFDGKNKSRPGVTCYEELVKKSINIDQYEGANFYGREHTGLILYSSGTTGLPKGVRLTHLNYLSTAYQDPSSLRPLTMLTVSPFANTMGFQNATNALTNGKTAIYLTKFSEDMYLRTIEKYKVQFILVAPPTVVILCKSTIIDKYDLSSLELLLCGGAPLESDVIAKVKARLPNLTYVLQGYGMTETSGVISRETETERKFGSVGRVVSGIILKVVDIESRKPLGPGQHGEICVKGSGVFEEYIGRNMDEYLEDGYLKTGDIGYYDEEGYIYVVDRLKELIKYKAWQVPPTELEGLLLKHPDVKDAAVIGKADKEAGELPTAFIVKRPESRATAQEIIEFVDSKVSPWKRLRGGVRFVEEIPKNPSGKILRRLLREALIKPASKL